MTEILPVLYQDEYLVAVNKPSGLLVHRSDIDRHETRFALQIVRNQLGQHVFHHVVVSTHPAEHIAASTEKYAWRVFGDVLPALFQSLIKEI